MRGWGIRRWDSLPKGLDFGITCPLIDDGIAAVSAVIYDMLCEAGVPGAGALSDSMDAAMLPIIEKVRQTNIAMRMAADDQIKALVAEVEELREEIERKEGEISRLERG